MIAEPNFGAHSAHVEMQLIIGGESISITHMGPNYLCVESDRVHPPGEATIVLQVDQSERRWTVLLPDGIPAEASRIPIAPSPR
jgi:hypothetical protein